MNKFIKLRKAHYSKLNFKIIAYRDDIVRIISEHDDEYYVVGSCYDEFFAVFKSDVFEVIDPKNLFLNTMTQREIEFYIWTGRSTNEFVSIRDVYTDEQILMLTNHPAWAEFTNVFRTSVYYAIDSMFYEMENQNDN